MSVPIPSVRSRQDAAILLAVAAISVGGTLLLASGSAAARSADPLAVVLLLGCAAMLLVRRSHPVACLTGTVAIALAYDGLGLPGAFSTITLAVALFSAMEARRRAAAMAATGIVVLGFAAFGAIAGRGHVTDLSAAGWLAGWLVVAMVTGEVQRGRRAYVEAVERRALEAERTREEEALRRATEERLRIARELHDVLGHHISTISVQAGVALHLLDRQPGTAREALEAINSTSKQALQDLRATLGLLRQVDEPEPLRPTPGLASLDELIATTRASGIDVALEVRGERRDLPTGVDVAAFRIIQESLTNVIRHAGARVARLAIRYGPDELEIDIADDGPEPAAGRAHVSQAKGEEAGGSLPGIAGPTGHGLVGMGERATALGGSLRAGPRTGGGFEVSVRLPLRRPL